MSDVKERQTRAREASLRAIREVEAALVRSLAGERLRGLPNLAPRILRPYYAANLRTRSVGERLGPDWSVVLDRDGTIRAASAGRETVFVRPVDDDELVAEDFGVIVARIADALRSHNERSAQARVRYDRTIVLADALARTVVAIFPEPSPEHLTVRRARRIG